METKVRIEPTREKATVKSLNALLADMQIFYQNLRGMHWNVEGMFFFLLHEKFEEFYSETADQIDEIAERIRMFDEEPLHTFSDYLRMADLDEYTHVKDGKEAVKIILKQSDELVQKMRKLLAEVDNQEDEVSSDLLTGFLSSFEKRKWMLKSFLK